MTASLNIRRGSLTRSTSSAVLAPSSPIVHALQRGSAHKQRGHSVDLLSVSSHVSLFTKPAMSPLDDDEESLRAFTNAVAAEFAYD